MPAVSRKTSVMAGAAKLAVKPMTNCANVCSCRSRSRRMEITKPMASSGRIEMPSGFAESESNHSPPLRARVAIVSG